MLLRAERRAAYSCPGALCGRRISNSWLRQVIGGSALRCLLYSSCRLLGYRDLSAVPANNRLLTDTKLPPIWLTPWANSPEVVVEGRSEEHTFELQSLMRNLYSDF